MFGIVFSDWRAETDKTNMFFRKFSSFALSEKKSKTHILPFEKKYNFSFGAFFYRF